ncbi:protein O-mannose kinase [Elysia marginata]|uniref:Protein O-mannose kinase n=1 Tax=Elysia marginata TaxID=1093978 RepID=A0AAV4J6U9_9GAST|nr:protein O-mannose kinase [Elysia marginata]
MTDCHKLLRCSDIAQDLIITDQVLGEGAQKMVKKGLWQSKEVAVSFLKDQDYLNDFQHGLKMMQLFAEEPGHRENRVVQLIGWCFENKPVIVTELHPLGAASGLPILLRGKFHEQDSLLLRFRMCIEFVQILNILHTHYMGPRVLCDANYPEKALSQFLLSDNLSLVLNDMDALPLVDRQLGQLVKCGHRELQGPFVAPEQRWDFDKEYDDLEMPHYDEKIDIWKIPDVCNFIIGDIYGASKIQLHLFNIHSKCKQAEPSKRPTAKEVLLFYKQIYKNLK